MSDFITTLERDLLDAAECLHRTPPDTTSQARRGRRPRLLIAALAVLVVATPALAGVPGVWHGVLAPTKRPTLTTRPPEERLLVELGALRRAATPADRSTNAMLAVTRAARSPPSVSTRFATSESPRSGTRSIWFPTARGSGSRRRENKRPVKRLHRSRCMRVPRPPAQHTGRAPLRVPSRNTCAGFSTNLACA